MPVSSIKLIRNIYRERLSNLPTPLIAFLYPFLISLPYLLLKDSAKAFVIIEMGFSLGAICFAGATFVGFLFGIPYTNKDERSPVNSNLEVIADWLTKILTGLALINLTKGYQAFSEFADAYSKTYDLDKSGPLAIQSVIVVFAVCGFFYGLIISRKLFLLQKETITDKPNTMTNYNLPSELISSLYTTFVNHVISKNVNPETGSGMEVEAFIQNSIEHAIEHNEIPTAYNGQTISKIMFKNLEDAFKNIIRLADQMANDAIADGSYRLHEWSLDKAKRRLCPLYPFLREPCNKYDPS